MSPLERKTNKAPKTPKVRLRPRIDASARREAWKKHYVHLPALRDPLNEGERHSTWLESLFDLAFAGAVGNLAVELARSYDFWALAHFLVLLVPILWSWIGQTFYSTRFDANDIWQTFFAIAQMGCVGGMAIYGAQSLSVGSKFFAISYAMCRLILIIQYVRTAQYIPKAWAYCMGTAYGFSIAMLLWVASVFVPEPYRYGVWALAMGIDLMTPQLLVKHNQYIKVHSSHIPERFGLLILIMISDIFVTQVNALASQKLDFMTLTLGALTFFVALATWWDYFEAVGGADPRGMDDKNTMHAFTAWMYLHFPYGAGLVLISGFARYGIMHGDIGKLTLSQTGVFTIAAVLVLLTPLFLWYSLPHHFGRKDHFQLGFRYMYQLVLIIPTAFAAYYFGVLAGLAALCFVFLVRFVAQMSDSSLATYFKQAKQEEALSAND